MELKKDVFQRPLGSAPLDLVQNMAVSFATAPLNFYKRPTVHQVGCAAARVSRVMGSQGSP